jgi:hypothetical protein
MMVLIWRPSYNNNNNNNNDIGRKAFVLRRWQTTRETEPVDLYSFTSGGFSMMEFGIWNTHILNTHIFKAHF